MTLEKGYMCALCIYYWCKFSYVWNCIKTKSYTPEYFHLPLTQTRLISSHVTASVLAICNTHPSGTHSAVSFHHPCLSSNVTSSERPLLTTLYKEAIFFLIFHPITWPFFIELTTHWTYDNTVIFIPPLKEP